MNELFHSLDLKFDVTELKNDLTHILTLTDWHPENNQICVQHRLGDEDNIWFGGSGKLGEWIDGKWSPYFNENDFDIINPALKGSYIEHVLDSLPFVPVRARLMKLRPKSCYSIHVDRTARYHMAIHTNSHARFVFTQDNQVYQIPEDGHVYFTNTIHEHTALNGGMVDRVHLVLLAK